MPSVGAVKVGIFAFGDSFGIRHLWWRDVGRDFSGQLSIRQAKLIYVATLRSGYLFFRGEPFFGTNHNRGGKRPEARLFIFALYDSSRARWRIFRNKENT